MRVLTVSSLADSSAASLLLLLLPTSSSKSHSSVLQPGSSNESRARMLDTLVNLLADSDVTVRNAEGGRGALVVVKEEVVSCGMVVVVNALLGCMRLAMLGGGVCAGAGLSGSLRLLLVSIVLQVGFLGGLVGMPVLVDEWLAVLSTSA